MLFLFFDFKETSNYQWEKPRSHRSKVSDHHHQQQQQPEATFHLKEKREKATNFKSHRGRGLTHKTTNKNTGEESVTRT